MDTNILSKRILSHRSWLMGISMLSIMLFHQHFIDEYSFPWFVFSAFGYLGVDVFLFLSGYGLVNSKDKYSLRVFYIRRILRILPMCLIAGGGKMYFCNVLGNADFISWKTFLGFDLWYIKAILIYYALMPLFSFAIDRYGRIILFFSFLLAAVVTLFVSNLLFYNLLLRLPVFLLGIYFAKNRFMLTSFLKKLSIPLLLSVIIVKILKIFHILPPKFDGLVILLFVWVVPVLCYYAMRFFQYLEKIKIAIILSFFGKHSLELYLWHEFVYFVIVSHFDLGLPLFWNLVIAILLSVFLAYCTYFINNLAIFVFTKNKQYLFR